VARSRRLPHEAIQPYFVEMPHPRSPAWREEAQKPRPLIWSELLGNRRPVEIEVGFGKGMFLLHASQARPDVNFFGVEIERKYVVVTAARLAKQGITNVRLACTDARWLLRECVAAESVRALHVYFPDPWWKHRHQKRKLFTAEFGLACARVLEPAGVLNFASDVREYFEATCDIVAEQGLLRRLSEESHAIEQQDFLTNFERKYRQEGRAIYRARFAK
jgi:tRNA (guanine-N7-)-methyltransferase